MVSRHTWRPAPVTIFGDGHVCYDRLRKCTGTDFNQVWPLGVYQHRSVQSTRCTFESDIYPIAGGKSTGCGRSSDFLAIVSVCGRPPVISRPTGPSNLCDHHPAHRPPVFPAAPPRLMAKSRGLTLTLGCHHQSCNSLSTPVSHLFGPARLNIATRLHPLQHQKRTRRGPRMY